MTIYKVTMTVSTFKSRYDTDPEFREAHIAYVKTQVKCSGCGRLVTRCNMTRHKKSNWHKKHSIYTTDISDYEGRKKEINRVYNKKIKEIEKERQSELSRIDGKIKKKLRD